MEAVGPVIAPERRVEFPVQDLEVTPRLPLLEEGAVGVQWLRSALLKDDPAAVLLVERPIDLPLPDEGGGDLLSRLGFLRVLVGAGARFTNGGEKLVHRVEI